MAAPVVATLPDDVLGDLRMLQQKHERFLAVRGQYDAYPYSVVKAAEDEFVRAAAILFEYLPTSAPSSR